MTVEEITNAFEHLYGGQPRIYRTPGRVNLIGEHTDYNEGFVMPMAINFSTYVAMTKRDDRVLRSPFRQTVRSSKSSIVPRLHAMSLTKSGAPRMLESRGSRKTSCMRSLTLASVLLTATER